MKKLTLGALAATIALGAMSPAFAHKHEDSYKADDFRIIYSKKSYDFVKARQVRHIEKIEVNDVIYNFTKTSKNHTAKFTDNAFDADIDLSIREILAEGLTLATTTESDITRINIHGSDVNKWRSGEEFFNRGGTKEEVEFDAKGGSSVKYIYHDGEGLKQSIGFDTVRRHYFSDYLQDVINTIHKDSVKSVADEPDEIVFDLGGEVVEGGSDYE